jgi:hypothetical protein
MNTSIQKYREVDFIRLLHDHRYLQGLEAALKTNVYTAETRFYETVEAIQKEVDQLDDRKAQSLLTDVDWCNATLVCFSFSIPPWCI